MTQRTVKIVRIADGDVARTFDVTGQTDRQVSKLADGISINLDHENWHVLDSADEEAVESR